MLLHICTLYFNKYVLHCKLVPQYLYLCREQINETMWSYKGKSNDPHPMVYPSPFFIILLTNILLVNPNWTFLCFSLNRYSSFNFAKAKICCSYFYCFLFASVLYFGLWQIFCITPNKVIALPTIATAIVGRDITIEKELKKEVKSY